MMKNYSGSPVHGMTHHDGAPSNVHTYVICRLSSLHPSKKHVTWRSGVRII